MEQLLLPIFMYDPHMITLTLGVKEQSETEYCLHSVMPIFSHAKGDLTQLAPSNL